ncbi:MAG TPA: hypothetical protein ENI23_17525 [bacterium]|nr:hypothetical protein [bacterium]
MSPEIPAKKQSSALKESLLRLIPNTWGLMFTLCAETHRLAVSSPERAQLVNEMSGAAVKSVEMPQIMYYVGDSLEGYALNFSLYYLLTLASFNKLPEKTKLIASTSLTIAFISAVELGLTNLTETPVATDIPVGATFALGFVLVNALTKKFVDSTSSKNSIKEIEIVT